MNRPYDLLTLGEVLLRLSPPDNERLSLGGTLCRCIGGAELNVAVGASLLGLHTGIITKLPDNYLSSYVKNTVRSMGVDDAYAVLDDSNDARLGIYYYENGAHPRKPRVVYDRKHTSATKLCIDDFPVEMFSSTRCFHTSGITLALGEQCRRTAIEMIRRCKAGGAIISCDVNFRANLWTGPEARACIEDLLPLVDIFFCSDSTARLTFLKEGTTEEILKSFTDDYPISVVAATQRTVHSPKCHSFGSVLYSAKKDTFYTEEPYRNIDVVDRIGSGDAYISGVLYGLLTKPEDYRRALEYGDAVSAVKNTVPGDMQATSLDEINSIIRDHKCAGPQLEMNR